MALKALELSPEIAECVDNCFEAAQACEACATECIQMNDADRERCIQLCRDTADLTSEHARFMARDSTFHGELASVCADACETCADECSKFDGQVIDACAEACRKAAETCRSMAAS